ncbi:MAG: prenyltransferase/squalene oxidase repeat-containing protein [Bradymonadia bacterium]
MKSMRIALGALALGAFTLVTPTVASSQGVDPAVADKAKKSVDKGLRFLRGLQDEKTGSYGNHVGLTSMVLTAFARSHRKYGYADGPYISRAADWLVSQSRADGAISGDATPTYNTALAIIALHAVDKVKFKDQIKRGQDFLARFQTDEDQKYKPTDKYYGGIGYGGDERPDLSNLQYALEALRETDYDPKSDVWGKAEVFISRCQNRSESNDQGWAGDDGGFVYEPGASKSKEGKLASYGAMTFAGLKSLIFTDVKKGDPRVGAAWGWIKKNYTFDEHPGMGQTSLFYYYQTAASALKAYGEATIPDGKGRPRNWANDLITKLMSMQKADGSWKNDDPKYWEGNPLLATARAVISMNAALDAAGAK